MDSALPVVAPQWAGCSWRVYASLWVSVMVCGVACTGPSPFHDERYAERDAYYQLTEAIGFDDWKFVSSRIGEDMDYVLDHPPGMYANVLHYASMNGSTNIVAHLLDRGANKLSRDWGGEMPIHKAIGAGQTNICEMLSRTDVVFAPRDERLMEAIVLDAIWQILMLASVEEKRIETLHLSVNGHVPSEHIIQDLTSFAKMLPFSEDFGEFARRRSNPFDQPSLAISASWVTDDEVDVRGVYRALKYSFWHTSFNGSLCFGYGLAKMRDAVGN